jgi:hypothetical protein
MKVMRTAILVGAILGGAAMAQADHFQRSLVGGLDRHGNPNTATRSYWSQGMGMTGALPGMELAERGYFPRPGSTQHKPATIIQSKGKYSTLRDLPHGVTLHGGSAVGYDVRLRRSGDVVKMSVARQGQTPFTEFELPSDMQLFKGNAYPGAPSPSLAVPWQSSSAGSRQALITLVHRERQTNATTVTSENPVLEIEADQQRYRVFLDDLK